MKKYNVYFDGYGGYPFKVLARNANDAEKKAVAFLKNPTSAKTVELAPKQNSEEWL